MHNPKTVAMHFGKKNELRNMWNYMTALRGNDDQYPNEMFKRVISTTIRGDAQYVGAYSFNEENGLGDYRQYCRDPKTVITNFQKVITTMHNHAMNHGEMGLKALSVYYEAKRKPQVAHLLRIMAAGLDDKNAEVTLRAWAELHTILS